MPVIRPTNRGEPVLTLRGHLTDLVVKELMGERTRRGPVVFEIPTEPGKVDVVVVWEAWKNLPQGERNTIIRDAYTQFARLLKESIHYIDPIKILSEPMVPESGTVMGVAWDDVVRDHLLPYSVRPMAIPTEVDPDDVRLLMIEVGALETPTGVQLRFPDAQMAADVHARLRDEMPEVNWAIVEETGSDDELRD
jgi:hypothetical protein